MGKHTGRHCATVFFVFLFLLFFLLIGFWQGVVSFFFGSKSFAGPHDIRCIVRLDSAVGIEKPTSTIAQLKWRKAYIDAVPYGTLANHSLLFICLTW